LPVTFVAAPVQTIRPPDEVLIENTEISGTDAFEEVIDLGTLTTLSDPLHKRLTEIVEQHGEGQLLKPGPTA
jgi:hypothetical protein